MRSLANLGSFAVLLGHASGVFVEYFPPYNVRGCILTTDTWEEFKAQGYLERALTAPNQHDGIFYLAYNRALVECGGDDDDDHRKRGWWGGHDDDDDDDDTTTTTSSGEYCDFNSYGDKSLHRWGKKAFYGFNGEPLRISTYYSYPKDLSSYYFPPDFEAAVAYSRTLEPQGFDDPEFGACYVESYNELRNLTSCLQPNNTFPFSQDPCELPLDQYLDPVIAPYWEPLCHREVQQIIPSFDLCSRTSLAPFSFAICSRLTAWADPPDCPAALGTLVYDVETESATCQCTQAFSSEGACGTPLAWPNNDPDPASEEVVAPEVFKVLGSPWYLAYGALLLFLALCYGSFRYAEHKERTGLGDYLSLVLALLGIGNTMTDVGMVAWLVGLVGGVTGIATGYTVLISAIFLWSTASTLKLVSTPRAPSHLGPMICIGFDGVLAIISHALLVPSVVIGIWAPETFFMYFSNLGEFFVFSKGWSVQGQWRLHIVSLGAFFIQSAGGFLAQMLVFRAVGFAGHIQIVALISTSLTGLARLGAARRVLRYYYLANRHIRRQPSLVVRSPTAATSRYFIYGSEASKPGSLDDDENLEVWQRNLFNSSTSLDFGPRATISNGTVMGRVSGGNLPDDLEEARRRRSDSLTYAREAILEDARAAVPPVVVEEHEMEEMPQLPEDSNGMPGVTLNPASRLVLPESPPERRVTWASSATTHGLPTSVSQASLSTLVGPDSNSPIGQMVTSPASRRRATQSFFKPDAMGVRRLPVAALHHASQKLSGRTRTKSTPSMDLDAVVAAHVAANSSAIQDDQVTLADADTALSEWIRDHPEYTTEQAVMAIFDREIDSESVSSVTSGDRP